jgi:aspartyl-tRNA(Asn)/glutamyl-tRNA(Gln) amidotransferase subunit C
MGVPRGDPEEPGLVVSQQQEALARADSDRPRQRRILEDADVISSDPSTGLVQRELSAPQQGFVRGIAAGGEEPDAGEELDRYGAQLGAILDYIAKLEKLDVSALEPLAQAVDTSNVFRDDVPRPSLPRDAALQNAPEKNGDFFIVPKIIE